jgi:hypothetical protein
MSSVASRTIRSSPYRDAAATWAVVIELLTGAKNTTARQALSAAAGIVASIIADRGPRDAPIVVTCDGPRTRIYCLYDEDAVEGSDATEDELGFDPLNGDWRISLPCHKDELPWVQSALEKCGHRITARDLAAGLVGDNTAAIEAASLILDPKGFLGS